MNRILSAIWLCAIAITAFATPVRVACIGNSITYGYGIADRDSLSYPAQLQRMLGPDYEVGNFGHSGATLLRHGHRPYTALPEWRQALEFHPDIAVIHLGVNDTDPRDWPLYGNEFVSDYVAIIDTLRMINPSMTIYIAELSPLRSSHYRYRSGTHQWRLDVQQAIKNVAAATGVELISFDTLLRDRQNLITDGIHPNAEGSGLLARTAYTAITRHNGGLRLPPVWQSGMVVQRDRPLRLHGSADAYCAVSVTVHPCGLTFDTRSDNMGEWSVTLPPFAVGDPYGITVSDGSDTLQLTDILAGDLWVASGQSNMAFPLSASRGGAEAAASSTDPMLRIYKQHPVALTNATMWPDSILAAVDTLGYFRPAIWQQATPESVADFSAIAYYFGRKLRSESGVPIGIIDNSVGGSTLESWIDIATLEAGMPEILVNWRTNDYLQPWAQQRIGENVGSDPIHRHPYEPSYLYSAAIRPLERLDICGVIWYQGESNAHNTMLFTQLMPMWADSWRRAFGNDTLPLHCVQLSSIDRSSWPEFRDAQRRMAAEIPGLTMTVSSDLGDSLDVHPTHKRPIGERLALQALRTSDDPRLFFDAPAAHTVGSQIVLTFPDSMTITTSDGNPASTFEIAATEGLYHPAAAEIEGSSITLSSPQVAEPHYVRYGWQPYTRANVISAGGDSLPLSTFRIEAEPDPDTVIEEGIEYGVSAPYAGNAGNRPIVAGGCNFPTAAPLASDAVKRYYQGIYAIDSANAGWQRIGTLPRPVAYGSSVTLPEGILLIGGTTYEGSLNEVWLLSADGRVTPMPALPVTIDNAGAAVIGSMVYVAGGNQNGTPSRRLWRLDISNLSKGWQKLSEMPGNPRTQLVMAASGGKLYAWGGFAPAHSGKPATLNTDGLMYDPTSRHWTSLPAPLDTEGSPVSLGGGAAVTLPDGRIAACGGVNAEVFLSALTDPQPDYLHHPVEWYRFNPDIFIFDPSSLGWSIHSTTPEAARAGGVLVADPQGGFYFTGGELKPRIRTSRNLHITF